MRLMRGVKGWVWASLLVAVAARGEELPRWEFGAGAVGLSMPNYRGSDERTGYVVPFPYVVYNGDRLRVNRDGIRSDLFRSDRIALNFSLAAGAPARSGAGAREDMPDLDPTFEFGPAIHVDLDNDAVGSGQWSLVFPLRGVIATDFRHVDSIGWVFTPYLQYEVPDFHNGWRLNVSGGPMYASERYHDYYYEVDQEFVTPERPAYDASGGYNGSRVTVTVGKRFRWHWIGMFARYDDFARAVFADSPLVRTHDSLILGVGMAWIFSRSAETVPESTTP
jgi:MipA family protein